MYLSQTVIKYLIDPNFLDMTRKCWKITVLPSIYFYTYFVLGQVSIPVRKPGTPRPWLPPLAVSSTSSRGSRTISSDSWFPLRTRTSSWVPSLGSCSRLCNVRSFHWNGWAPQAERIIEPRHEKTKVLVTDLVRHKPGCTATEDG